MDPFYLESNTKLSDEENNNQEDREEIHPPQELHEEDASESKNLDQ